MPRRSAFTLIELLVVIAIIAILAVVVVLTLNPAQLLAQSRDANRVSDMATLQSAINLYTTDQSGSLNLGAVSSTYISVPDPNASTTCGSLGLPSLGTSTGQYWTCSSPSNYRLSTSTGWLGINFNTISAGSPFGSLPVDPVNQTSSGLFYAYNTNGSQFQVTANLESAKYKGNYGANPQISAFPDVVSGGTPGVSALYNSSGLVGWWPLTEGSGTSALDQSGNGNNGTWSGTMPNGSYYTTGKIGPYAGSFYHDYDEVTVTNPSPSMQVASFTVMGWINMSASVSFSSIVLATSTGSVPINIYTRNGGGVSCYLNNSAAGAAVSVTPASTWLQFACTWNGSAINVYINGASAVAPTSYAGTLTYNSGYQFIIGNKSITASMDDIRIYNRALSPAEVMALYNAEK